MPAYQGIELEAAIGKTIIDIVWGDSLTGVELWLSDGSFFRVDSVNASRVLACVGQR